MKTCIHPALFQDMLLLVDWIVWRIFCWHILGPLIPSEQCLNATVLHGITMSISFWLQFPHFLINGEIYHKAEIISNHFKKAWRHLTSKLTRCHSISPRLRCGGVEDLHCGGEADKSAQCYLISMSHYVPLLDFQITLWVKMNSWFLCFVPINKKVVLSQWASFSSSVMISSY